MQILVAQWDGKDRLHLLRLLPGEELAADNCPTRVTAAEWAVIAVLRPGEHYNVTGTADMEFVAVDDDHPYFQLEWSDVPDEWHSEGLFDRSDLSSELDECVVPGDCWDRVDALPVSGSHTFTVQGDSRALRITRVA